MPVHINVLFTTTNNSLKKIIIPILQVRKLTLGKIKIYVELLELL